MNQIDLNIRLRETQSKNANGRSRRKGDLPGVLYGTDKASQPLLVDRESFRKLLPKIHRSTVFNLKVEGGSGEVEQAVIRAMQRDPVRHDLLHVDFLRIQADKPIIVDVPIHGVGSPIGVKLGGVLDIVTRRIHVKVLPLQVPEDIKIDISGLVMGKSLHVSDLAIPEGVEVLTPMHETLFIVQVPKALEASVKAAEVEGAAAAPVDPKKAAADAKKGGAADAKKPAADAKKGADAKKPEAKKADGKKK